MVTLSVLHVFLEYVKDTESIYAFKKKIWGVDLQHTIGSLSNKDKRHLKSEFEPLQTSETLSRIFHLVRFVKCWQFFLELKRLPSKLRNRKSSSCVHVHHETWNKAFSRHTRAVTAKKCSKKREARAELFCQSKPTVFLFAVLVDVAVAQRRRQQWRQKTIGFMTKTTALHVHHVF